MNPNIEKADHVLNLDEADNRPNLQTVIDTAEWYGLSKNQGAGIVEQVLGVTRPWREYALERGIARADIELTASAFTQTDAHFASARD